MTFTIRSLLGLSEARTVSLTPGIGEDRQILWAHVCELAEPWRWLGEGSLVMTTGLRFPAEAEEQIAYFRGMHAANIAGVALDLEMSAAPLQPAALAAASSIGFPVLMTAHEVPYAVIGMAVADAERRRGEWHHGALLLTSLCDGSVPAGPAAHLVAAYGVHAPYTVAAVQGEDAESLFEATGDLLTANHSPALGTVSEGQLLLVGQAGAEFERLLAALALEHRVGASARVESLDVLHTAVRQARSALIRNRETGFVMRFEEHETSSLFLPNDPEQLRGIARQVLGPLQTYDEQRGTELTHTLRVFLEESRSWVHAAERLYVHRQTLVARISRIEKITDRDLSSMEDMAECWLAIQAAIGSGDLPAGDGAPPAQTTMPDQEEDA